MCKFHLYFILLLCQIALRNHSPLKVHCTLLYYLYSAPVVPLHAVLYMPVMRAAEMRVSGLPLFVVRAAVMRAAGVRAALAASKDAVSFIITKIF